MFRHRYRYFFIALLSFYTLGNTILCGVYEHFNIEIEWYYSLLTIFGITLITWEGNRIIEPALFKSIPNSRHHIRFIIYFYLAGNIINCLGVLLMVYLVGGLLHGYSWEQNFNPLKLTFIYGALANLLFHLVNTIFLFFREKEQYWKQAEELRKISAQAEMQLIKSQVNPHFLFNNLNVLSAMVIKDNPDANKFIEEFSQVYRYVLNNHEKEVVLISTELEFIDSYLYLLKKRFTNALNVSISIPHYYANSYIIPAALQMLIENAIKHNVVSTARPLTIDIHANGNHTLVVKNNLQPRKIVEGSTKIGLQNIHKRYWLISGKNIEIRRDSQSFEVILPILELT